MEISADQRCWVWKLCIQIRRNIVLNFDVPKLKYYAAKLKFDAKANNFIECTAAFYVTFEKVVQAHCTMLES
ncbi:hypothetical protein A4A49_33293 [Nicotiana attenuata]|uniref:Uncharacterized protein n=1 Tax=Nicotiana attenuata TaxID=49451 RepID=A0A1J6KRP3_NICAT|nr:hypothetical protein A4A49_33293 [Nicotiana attenuata]